MGGLRVALLLAALALAHATLDASVNAPGGLSPRRTPQLVLFTHDDAITSKTYDSMMAVMEGVAANGCPMSATFFTTSSGTDCDLLVDLYQRGSEIAGHTQTHPSLLGLDRPQLVKELLGSRTKLAQCGIPERDIVGNRAPFLEIKKEVWELLNSAGFLYDSTLIENTQGQSISGGMGDRVWPWDMANGIPINCAWYNGIQKCKGASSYPGLWQVPLWDLSAKGTFTMDYGDGCSGRNCVYDILKANWEEAYYGNRAPFPLFIHTYWLAKGSHLQQLRRFVDEVSQLPDVYFVTMRQLLAWMKAPVPADAITPANARALLGCGNPGGAGPAPVPRLPGAQIATRLAPGAEAAAAPAPAPAPSVEEEEEEQPADERDTEDEMPEDEQPDKGQADEEEQPKRKEVQEASMADTLDALHAQIRGSR